MWEIVENRQYDTQIKIDGVDQSENLIDMNISYDLDGSSVSSIFGSVLRYEIELEVFGEIEGKDLHIFFGYYTGDYVDEPSFDIKEFGSFRIYESDYDEKMNTTKLKAMTDLTSLDDEFSLQTIEDVKTTNEILTKSLKEGENIVLPKHDYPIKDISDKFYARRLDLFQDIAKITKTYLEVSTKERNLIPNGWDSFLAYGSGKNYLAHSSTFEDWDEMNGTEATFEQGVYFKDLDIHKATRIKTKKGRSQVQLKGIVAVQDRGELNYSIFVKNLSPNRMFFHVFNPLSFHSIASGEFVELKGSAEVLESLEFGGDFDLDFIAWRPLVFKDGDEPLTVIKTPLENGLTRIQTWGGNNRVKLIYSNPIGTPYIVSFFLKTDKYFEYMTSDNTAKAVRKYEDLFFIESSYRFSVLGRILTLKVDDNLDFIASDPKITDHELEQSFVFKEIEETNTTLPVFELEHGDVLEPIDTVDITWHYGDNVADGTGKSILQLDQVELIRDDKETFAPLMLDLYKGFTHQEVKFKSPSHPFVGGIVNLDSKLEVTKALITKGKFNVKSWVGEYESEIIEQDENHTNYVGNYEKSILETGIKVDKVSGEIEAVVNEQTIIGDNVQEVLGEIALTKDKLEIEIAEREQQGEDLINYTGTLIDQTVDGLRIDITDTNKRLDELGEESDKYNMYFDFRDDGLGIGRKDSQYKAQITNEGLEFTENDVTVTEISRQRLMTDRAVIGESIIIGKTKIEVSQFNDERVIWRKI